jgi:hypothetical protein
MVSNKMSWSCLRRERERERETHCLLISNIKLPTVLLHRPTVDLRENCNKISTLRNFKQISAEY